MYQFSYFYEATRVISLYCFFIRRERIFRSHTGPFMSFARHRRQFLLRVSTYRLYKNSSRLRRNKSSRNVSSPTCYNRKRIRRGTVRGFSGHPVDTASPFNRRRRARVRTKSAVGSRAVIPVRDRKRYPFSSSAER